MPPEQFRQDITGLSIVRIRELIDTAEPDAMLVDALSSDPRAGVRALSRNLENRRRRAIMLRNRQESLLALEKKLRNDGLKLIAGVDEAGRGPLAGPVVAASVILPDDIDIPGIDDSKKLSPQRREELYVLITARAHAWGIGMTDNEEIDAFNILDATMKAMRSAVENMGVVPNIVLVDGNRSPGCSCRERLVTDGDSLCRCIAAASILAKVTRDRIMTEMDRMFPVYGFARHKGYGAPEHIEAIAKYGPCILHRISFRIVPARSPAGTSAAVLKNRLINAPTREVLDRAAAGIAHIRDTLNHRDIEMLREVYRACAGRFNGR